MPTASKTAAPETMSLWAVVMTSLPPERPWAGRACRRRCPAPDFRAFAALEHSLAINVGDHVSVPAQERLGRAHLGAGREFALREPVRPILREFFLRKVFFRTPGAEGAL